MPVNVNEYNYLGIGEYVETIVTSDDLKYGEFADGYLSIPMAKLPNGDIVDLNDCTWISEEDYVTSKFSELTKKGVIINSLPD